MCGGGGLLLHVPMLWLKTRLIQKPGHANLDTSRSFENSSISCGSASSFSCWNGALIPPAPFLGASRLGLLWGQLLLYPHFFIVLLHPQRSKCHGAMGHQGSV